MAKLDIAEAEAALEALFATPGELPVEVYPKIIEFAGIVRPMYRTNGKWDDLVTRIHERFGVNVVVEVESPLLAAIPVAFRAPEKFEDIIEGGWFGDYLTYTRESEAPAQFHFGAALTCVAATFERRPLIGWEAAPTYPNIYALIVGPTGTRKSTALNKAKDLVASAFPKVNGKPARVNVLPNEGSPQGYASALRRRNFEVSRISDGLIVASELTVLVGVDTYKRALGEWLTDWYDNLSDPWSRALKGEDTYELPAPYVCFAGASNMTWLKEIPEQLIKAGYMPRHLVFNAREKRHDNANPLFDMGQREALMAALRAAVETIPDTLPLSIAAAKLIDDWYMKKVTRQERAETDELFAAWLARKLPHAIKMATVWQIADGGPRDALHVDWARRAIRMVDWMDKGVLTVYRALGSTSEGAVSDAILDYIGRKGGTLTLAALARGLKNRYNKRSINEGVQTLLMARMLKTTHDDVQGTTYTIAEDVEWGK